MTDLATSRRPALWRILGWGFLALLLSLPAVLLFRWTASDFIIMGLLLGSVGLGIEYLVRRSGNAFVRLGALMAVLTAFLTIWVNLAVGMIGDDNAYNLLFGGVVLFALGSMLWARLEPRRTALLMLVTAGLQGASGLGGYSQDPRGAVLSAGFAIFWLLAGALFRAGASR